MDSRPPPVRMWCLPLEDPKRRLRDIGDRVALLGTTLLLWRRR